MTKLGAALLLFSMAISASDFQAGLDTYNHGDFAAALKEWQPLAEQGDANSQYNLGLLYALGKGVARGITNKLSRGTGRRPNRTSPPPNITWA